MVNTPGPKAALSNFKATPLPKQDVVVRHPHMFKQHFGVPMRRIVITEHRQWAHDVHTRCIDRYQDHRVLLMTRAFRIAQPHENQNFAAWVAGAGSPPFTTIDHPFITITHGAGVHVGGIRRCDIGFSHGKRRTNLAAQQWFEPLLFLRRAGVTHQHFHIAGVRGGTVEWLGAKH